MSHWSIVRNYVASPSGVLLLYFSSVSRTPRRIEKCVPLQNVMPDLEVRPSFRQGKGAVSDRIL